MDGTNDDLNRNIPADTDILIMHQSPRGICDTADYASAPVYHGGGTLAERIKTMKLKCHLFGHKNYAYEHKTVDKTVYPNAAVLDDKYNLYGEPYLITI